MFKVLVAIDNFDSPLALRTMEEAVAVARGRTDGCSLTVLHVISDTTNTNLSTSFPMQPGTPLMYPFPGAAAPAVSTMQEQNQPDVIGIPDEYTSAGVGLSEQDDVVERAATWLKERGLECETVSRDGDPAGEICQYAEDYAIDMIIIGRHDKGAIARIFLGSVSKKVVEASPVSVLVVK